MVEVFLPLQINILLQEVNKRDGSSRFYNGVDLNNVWGTFVSASGAWKIKNEKFLKIQNFLRLKTKSRVGVKLGSKSWRMV